VTDTAVAFNDADAYERFMGRWSRAVGTQFIEWFAPPTNARWLDLGCGTGVFTELILKICAPAAVTAIDPAPEQVAHARKQPAARHADFQVGDAQSLPFEDASFDVIASALVINFIPDRRKAVQEMRRVARPGGMIGAYVWDYLEERTAGSSLRLGLRDIGVEPPSMPGAVDASIPALTALFRQAGLEALSCHSIDVTLTFPDFDDFWTSQMPSFTPQTRLIRALPKTQQNDLKEAVKRRLSIGPGGSVSHTARANAIKARVPA